MLAAETALEALRDGRHLGRARSQAFAEKVDASYVKKELWAVRNFHQGFKHGLWAGLFHTGLQMVTGGRGLVDPMTPVEGLRRDGEARRRLTGRGRPATTSRARRWTAPSPSTA